MSKELVYDAQTGEIQEHTTPIEALTRSEVEAQVSTARRYPRSLDAFLKAATGMVTYDEETAAACFYSLPRAGKMVTGPSVKLAKIVASTWGHMRTETRVVGEDDRFVTVQSTAWDVQNNVLNRQEVRRRITDKHGKRYSDDMIGTTTAAASSIAYRNAVFSVIPDVYVRRLEGAARRTAVGDEKTLTDRRDAALTYWAKAGISQDRVFAALGKKSVDEIDLEDLAILKGLVTAIKDGTTSLDAAFPAAAGPLREGKGFGFGKKPAVEKPGSQEPRGNSQGSEAGEPSKNVEHAPPGDEGNTKAMLLAQVAEASNAGDLIALANDLPTYLERELAPRAREEVLAAIESKLQAVAKG